MWHRERARLAVRILFLGLTISFIGVAALNWARDQMSLETFASVSLAIIIVMGALYLLAHRATVRRFDRGRGRGRRLGRDAGAAGED